MRVFWRRSFIASLALAIYIVPIIPIAFAQQDANLGNKKDAVKTALPIQSWVEFSPNAASLSAGTANSTATSSSKASDKHVTAVSDKPSSIFNTLLTNEFPNKQWWLKFGDPNLENYITEAVRNSPRLEASLERIKQARAEVSIAFAKQLPSLSFNPLYLRAALPNSIAGGGLPNAIQAFLLSFAPSYEVDLFGKNWDRTQSAKKELEAVELDNKALLVSLEGEVAATYFNLLRSDELVNDQEKNLALLKQINELKRYQYDVGLTNYDEIVRSERDVVQAITNINSYQQQQASFAHQLSVLVGRPPNAQGNMVRGTLTQIALPAETETGIPSDLLLRRPDIMASERRLQQAAIDVKVARKAFLPNINLSAILTTTGQEIGDIVNMDNFTHIEFAQISQPVFQGGRLVGESKYQKAHMREQVVNYRQSLLIAMKEVEDQLSMLKSNYENINSNTQRLELTQHSMHIAELQYRQDLIPRLNVLLAQSELIQYQQLSINSKADVLISTVNLFKALGGGY